MEVLKRCQRTHYLFFKFKFLRYTVFRRKTIPKPSTIFFLCNAFVDCFFFPFIRSAETQFSIKHAKTPTSRAQPSQQCHPQFAFATCNLQPCNDCGDSWGNNHKSEWHPSTSRWRQRQEIRGDLSRSAPAPWPIQLGVRPVASYMPIKKSNLHANARFLAKQIPTDKQRKLYILFLDF